jgi:uncharacterized membrane protein
MKTTGIHPGPLSKKPLYHKSTVNLLKPARPGGFFLFPDPVPAFLLLLHMAQKPGGFRNRGHEVRRIETFSDAVFAFAVTLLIVSLEVPKTFEELLISMRGFVAFGICFCLLLLIWHEQHVFFRRYGLDDRPTIMLNSTLLFIVLFFVYPLKFLFTLIFGDNIYGAGKSPFSIRQDQVPQLMTVYGIGYITIYGIFLLLYVHALRNKDILELNQLEVFDTRTKIYAQAILIGIGLFCILLAYLLPVRMAGTSGMFYMLIGPAFWVYFSRRGRIRKRLAAAITHPLQ